MCQCTLCILWHGGRSLKARDTAAKDNFTLEIHGVGLTYRKQLEEKDEGAREGVTQLQGRGRVGMLSAGVERLGERF